LPEVSSIVRSGCTVVFLGDTDKGPILARNQDIEPDVSVEMQVRQIRRPIGRAASVVMTYAGFVAGTGFNANGVGVGATSAHSIHPDGKGNLPFSLFFHLLLQQCASVDDFINRFSEQTYYGKTVVGLMADAGGSSAGFEMNPGSPLTFVPRRQDRDWQAYTNHYQKSVEQIAPEVEYLQNSYARYGRLLHRLAEVPIARTAAELRQLMTEVAEPGLVVSPKDLSFPTAYTTLYYLKHGRATVLDGHPSKAQPMEVCL
jgi:hypothetical protein